MKCPREHCGGTILVLFDEVGGAYAQCSLCGRSPETPPTEAQLRAAGIMHHMGPLRETDGRRGPKGAIEYSPSPVGLVRPLAPWRR